MRRRDFIAGIAGSTAAWPLTSHAQRDGIRRIGALIALGESDAEGQAQIAAFWEGLRKFGWAEGRNIQIDIRRATAGDAGLRQRFAEELVALQPDLIVSQSTANTATVLQRTRTIPVVFVQVADPIGSGFVASFPRPGGNATGFTTFEPAIVGKWVELLKEIAPLVNRIAFLFNPATTATFAEIYLNPFKAAAVSFTVEAISAPVRNISDVESVAAVHARVPNSGLMVMPDPFFAAHSVEVTALAARYRLPTIAPYRFYAERGGLLSYGNDVTDNFRRAAAYADRILRGEKPSELPVQLPVKFELVINMKTAKALGLDVPVHLQQRADEVIE
jgi:putative tryptophan/tyrosine transport system substrate-binding protein